MTVQEIKEDGVTCIWSDGKRVRSEIFNPSLTITKSGAITAINIRIVYSDKDVDELAAEMRHAGTATDDNGFYIADEQARLTLKRRLGPEKQSGAVPARG